MARFLKIILYTSTFLFICMCVGIFVHRNNNHKPMTPVAVQNREPMQTKPSETQKTKTVSVENSPTEKYILKYNQNTDTVYLITQKTDGTQIMSPVESINPFYLTSEDISTLIQGIELTNREDMYILIEDFSS